MTNTSFKCTITKIADYCSNGLLQSFMFIKHNLLCVIAIAFAFLIALLSFNYIDGVTETCWTLTIWDAIFQGRLLEYSEMTFENMRGAPHSGDVGGFMSLLPWAIWNFPLWLFYPTPDSGTVNNPACIIWSKLFLIICLIGACCIVRKISSKLTNDNTVADYSFILCISAGTAIISTGYAGQNEIIYVLTFLASIYCFISDHRVISTGLMVYSLGCYPLLVIPLMLLLLIKNYGLIKTIVISIIELILGMVIFSIGSSSTSSSYGSASEFLSKTFFSTPITLETGTISIFMVSLVLIAFYCIIRINDYNADSAIVCITIFFTSMMLFCWMMFYRYYVCIPPLVISLMLLFKNDRNNFKIGLLFFTLINYISCLVVCRNIYVWDYLSFQGVLSNYLVMDYPNNFLWILFGENVTIGMDLIYSVLIACSLIYLYILVIKPNNCKTITINEKTLVTINALCPAVLLLLYFAVPIIVL